MAGGALLETGSQGETQYNGRITWFVVMSSVIAALGGAIFGYDSGVSGGVTSMESFLERFFPEVYAQMEQDISTSNYCKFNSQLLTLFTSSLYLAGLFASLFASSITRNYGRKPSFLLGGVSVLIGSAIGGLAVDIYMLIIGRLLLGIGVGFANQAIPMNLVEMAPAKYRGAFNNGFTLSLSLGVLVTGLVNYFAAKIDGGWGWRISIALTAVPAFILTFGALFLSKTPNSIIQRTDDYQKAELVLQKIRGTDEVQEELNDLIQASMTSETIKKPFKRLISERKYKPQLLMATIVPFFQQMTGVNVVGFYAPVLFRTIGLGESASLLSTVLIGTMGIFACIISMVTVDKFRRRSLFFLGGIQMFLSIVTTGIILATKLRDTGSLNDRYAYLVLIFLCTYVIGFSMSWGPLSWLVPSEIFQLEIRSPAQGITIAVNFGCTFFIAQTLLAMLCKFKSGIFFFFAG